MCAKCPVHLILLDLIILTTLGVQIMKLLIVHQSILTGKTNASVEEIYT
jgi:hypothetical protein